MADPKLMDYFKFDEADLAANRLGRFTSKQQERLVHQDSTRRRGGLAGAIVALMVAAASLVFAVVFLVTNKDPESVVEMTVAFGVVVPLLFGLFGIRGLWKALARRQIQLASVQGPVKIVVRTSYNDDMRLTYTDLHVGGRKFVAPESLANIMVNGAQYTIFYADGGDAIVSVEALGAGN